MYTSYIDLLKDVNQNGELISPSSVSQNRSFQTKELNNIQLKIDDFKQYLLNDKEVEFFSKELDWYFDKFETTKAEQKVIGDDHSKHTYKEKPLPTYDMQLKQLRNMASDLGIQNRCGPNSNYGSMMLRLENHIGMTQFKWVTEKLRADKSSRQAVAFYNGPMYQYVSNTDFVCCLSQMFNIKGNKLNTVINSRSNDLVNCFRYDSIWWNLFQQIVLNELKKDYPDLEMGYMLVNIFSAHIYLKDNDKLNILLDSSYNFKTLQYNI